MSNYGYLLPEQKKKYFSGWFLSLINFWFLRGPIVGLQFIFIKDT